MTSSPFALPAAVAERTPLMNLTVAPEAQLPAPVPVSGPQQQRALELARSVQSTFDSKTACYGNGVRSPVSRFSDEQSNRVAGWGMFGLLASVGAAGIGHAFGSDVSALGFFGGLGAAMASVVVPLFGSAAERAFTSKRVLSSDALAPMRTAYDAAPADSLERAVIAKLAVSNLADLDWRRVRGEPPRAVLRSIIAEGETLPQNAKDAAAALLECYAMVHNNRGGLTREITEPVATKLEHALARANESMRAELRTTLMTTLFDGERLRTSARPQVEARLYRVLTGEVEPKKPLVIAAPTLDGAALEATARELQGKLFDRDGELTRPLTVADGQKLFALLRSTGIKTAE